MRVIFSVIGISTLLFTISIIGTPQVATAATAENCSKAGGGFLDFPTWYKFLEPSFDDPDGPNGPIAGECNLSYPLDADNNPSFVLALPRILLAIFEIILRVGGLAAVGFTIFGGIQYILSQGEPERTKASKNTIVNALVGLVIAMTATIIVNLIGNGLT